MILNLVIVDRKVIALNKDIKITCSMNLHLVTILLFNHRLYWYCISFFH